MTGIQHPKVVVIGAGSLFFGRQAIWQMAHSPYLNRGTLALVDKDPIRLGKMGTLAENVVADSDAILSELLAAQRDALPDHWYAETAF